MKSIRVPDFIHTELNTRRKPGQSYWGVIAELLEEVEL